MATMNAAQTSVDTTITNMSVVDNKNNEISNQADTIATIILITGLVLIVMIYLFLKLVEWLD